jgi:1,4-alpha-glucan branching enzyme
VWGVEFAPWREWSEERECDWWLLAHAPHQGMQGLVRRLNALHRSIPALHARDCEAGGFQWIEPDDATHSTFSWLRLGEEGDAPVAVFCNFTPIRRRLRFGLPVAGRWRVLLSTDDAGYGGTGEALEGEPLAEAVPWQRQPASALIDLPPLGALYLQPAEWPPATKEDPEESTTCPTTAP